jgi:threonylcarbamoyladenosine tRNA methylthiotransferase MtaB
MRPVFIKTFGCKVNFAESDGFADLMRGEGFTPVTVSSADLPGPDEVAQPVVFVNGCCVTAEAERKASQFVRRLKRSRPDCEVLFSGCAARNYATRQRYADAGARVFDFYPEAFEWVKANVAPVGTLLAASETRTMHDQFLDAASSVPTKQEAFPTGVVAPARARAFLKVQDGCHNCCTFCIIPFVRPYASRPFDELLAEVDRRLDEGVREIVLTGVNIGHYGLTPVAPVNEVASQKLFRRSRLYVPIPGHPTLWNLIDAILNRLTLALERDGIEARLRISSIEPEDIEPRFFTQLAHPRMCPHLHLPLQSGSDPVLADMRRLYDMETYMRRVESFRDSCPDGALTTDILVGFPTETEADFERTLDVVTAAGFERVHGFPFSPRTGTRAALLKQLPHAVALERNRRLIEHSSAVADPRWQRFLATSSRVLIEERKGGHWHGHGEAYQLVQLEAEAGSELAGTMVDVKLREYAGGGFFGAVNR